MKMQHDRACATAALPPSLLALLHEIADLQERLATRDEPGAIDLRALPLLPGEREALRSVLGQGEVTVRLDALGESEIHETRLAGVWWVRHADREGETVAEFIEVATVPAILHSDRRDVENACHVLREQLREWAGSGNAGEES